MVLYPALPCLDGAVAPYIKIYFWACPHAWLGGALASGFAIALSRLALGGETRPFGAALRLPHTEYAFGLHRLEPYPPFIE